MKLYFPTTQLVQFTLLMGEKDPASQGAQMVEADDCCVRDPAAHLMHSPVSATGAYFPDSQSTQTLALATYWPAAQLPQVIRSDEENFPISQSVHEPLAVIDVYVPAGHRLHDADPAAANFPTVQS